MGENGYCRGLFALAMSVGLLAPGVMAETPQVVTLGASAPAADEWQFVSEEPADELAYAETGGDWSSDLAPSTQDNASYWVAEGDSSDYVEASAAQDAAAGLGITVDLTWVSKYMFRGIDVHDDSGAYQPSVELELWDSGLTIGYWGSYASGDRDRILAAPFDRRDLDEHDYYIYYNCSPVDGVDIELGWIYYDFIHLNSNYDYHEPYGIVTLSNLPLSPYFGAYYGFPKRDNRGVVGEGWNTTFGLSHSIEMGCLSFCGSEPLSLDLSWEIWHQGGQYGLPTGWTHQIFGLATTIPVSEKIEFTPAVYWQDSFDNNAGPGTNPEDDWWASLSLTYSY